MVDFDELTEEQMDDLTQQVLDLYTTISEEALSITILMFMLKFVKSLMMMTIQWNADLETYLTMMMLILQSLKLTIGLLQKYGLLVLKSN